MNVAFAKGGTVPNKKKHKHNMSPGERKAKSANRERLEELHAASEPTKTTGPKKEGKAKKAEVAQTTSGTSHAKKAEARKARKPGRVRTWFKDVRTEMARVTWPTKTELRNYSFGVIGMLVVFGVAVWLVDTGVVAALVGYSGLRG